EAVRKALVERIEVSSKRPVRKAKKSAALRAKAALARIEAAPPETAYSYFRLVLKGAGSTVPSRYDLLLNTGGRCAAAVSTGSSSAYLPACALSFDGSTIICLRCFARPDGQGEPLPREYKRA